MRKSISINQSKKKPQWFRQPLDKKTCRRAISTQAYKLPVPPPTPNPTKKALESPASSISSQPRSGPPHLRSHPTTLNLDIIRFKIRKTSTEETLLTYLNKVIVGTANDHHIGNLSLKALITGGWVRDKILGLQPRDINLVVHPKLLAELVHKLSNLRKDKRGAGDHEEIKKISSDFLLVEREKQKPIKIWKYCLKVNEEALIRLEVSAIHKAYIQEDSTTRDLGINALYYDIYTHQIVDPLKSRLEFNRRILKPCTSSVDFATDFTRVVRLARLKAITGFKVANHLWQYLEELDRSTFKPAASIKLEFERVCSEKQVSLEKILDVLMSMDLLSCFPFPYNSDNSGAFDELSYTRRLLQMARTLDSEGMAHCFSDELVYRSKEPPFGSFRGQVVKLFWLFIYLTSFNDFKDQGRTTERMEAALERADINKICRINLQRLMSLTHASDQEDSDLSEGRTDDLHNNFYFLIKNDLFSVSSLGSSSQMFKLGPSPTTESSIISETAEDLFLFQKVDGGAEEDESSSLDDLSGYELTGFGKVNLKRGRISSEQYLSTTDQILSQNLSVHRRKCLKAHKRQLGSETNEKFKEVDLLGFGQSWGPEASQEISGSSSLSNTETFVETIKDSRDNTNPKSEAFPKALKHTEPGKKALIDGSGSTDDRGSSSSQSYIIEPSFAFRNWKPKNSVQRALFSEFEKCRDTKTSLDSFPQHRYKGREDEAKKTFPSKMSSSVVSEVITRRSVVQKKTIKPLRARKREQAEFVCFRDFGDLARFIMGLLVGVLLLNTFQMF